MKTKTSVYDADQPDQQADDLFDKPKFTRLVTPRKIRGEWHKAAREDAVSAIRLHLERKRSKAGKAPVAEQERGILAIYFVSVYYKLILRLPDIRRHKPEWIDKTVTMARYAKDQTYLLAPYLNLLEYEPWEEG